MADTYLIDRPSTVHYSYSELVRQYGIGIRVLGDTSLLPEDVRQVIRKAVDLTKKNNRAILNMCFPYTSREELTMATRSLVSGIEAHDLNPRQVSSFVYILGSHDT
jgi:ditrans,polycis-polyprenyl diphosphate synthase